MIERATCKINITDITLIFPNYFHRLVLPRLIATLKLGALENAMNSGLMDSERFQHQAIGLQEIC